MTQSAKERQVAIDANIEKIKSKEELMKAEEIAKRKIIEAEELSTDLLRTKENHKELLKNHKTFVNVNKLESERIFTEHEALMKAKDMRIHQLEEKVRNVEQLGRALLGDADLVVRDCCVCNAIIYIYPPSPSSPLPLLPAYTHPSPLSLYRTVWMI